MDLTRPARLRDYELTAKNGRGFKTLAEMTAATGQEAHGVEMDYDIFENVRAPERGQRHAVYHAGGLDFRLRPGGKAVDAGVRLPNVNDDFAGRAPDLGVYGAGQPCPGLRTTGPDWRPALLQVILGCTEPRP